MLLGAKKFTISLLPRQSLLLKAAQTMFFSRLKKKRENTQRCKKSDEAFIEHEFANEITFVFGENTRTLKIRSIFSP